MCQNDNLLMIVTIGKSGVKKGWLSTQQWMALNFFLNSYTAPEAWERLRLKFGRPSAVLISTDRSIFDSEIIFQFLFILAERLRIMATAHQPADAG
jgi:hypothetical protein